jgi:hypothetical protein
MLTIAESLLKRDKGHRFGLIEIGRKGDRQTQLDQEGFAEST